MSAEGKKKRGESGRKNAESIPFRNGGSKCNLSTKIGRTDRTGGARMVHAISASNVLIGMGYPCGYTPSARLLRMWEDGEKRVA